MRTIFSLVLLLLINSTSLAQEHVIPFEEDNWVYVNVKVNDSEEPLSFVFDTGASSTVISAKAADRIGIKTNRTTNVSGAGGNESYKLAYDQTVHFESFSLKNLSLVIVNLNHLAERSGRPIDGIIGYDVISNFVTQLDFDADQIKLYKDVNDVSGIENYSKKRINGNATIPIVPIQMTLKNGKKLKGRFFFDSGASTTLIFTSPFVKKYDLEDNIGDTFSNKSSGLTSTTSNTIGQLATLDFNGFVFEDVPVTLSKAKQGVLSRKNVSGILGAEVISRFQIVLDYNNNALYFKPNKAINKPFRRNLCGFSPIKKDGKFYIDFVVENSPANRMGITKDDELIRVNDYLVEDMNVIEELLQQEGKTIELELKKSDGRIKVYQLKLERLIG